MGSKIDKIYAAYQAEDEKGRKQIDQYLQLLTARYMLSVLGQNDTVLTPPSEEPSHGEYPVGTFLVFDWERNCRDLTVQHGFKDVEVYTIGRNIAPFTFNPLMQPVG